MDDIPSLCGVLVVGRDLFDLVIWQRRKDEIFGGVEQLSKLHKCLGGAAVVIRMHMDTGTNERDQTFPLVGRLELFDAMGTQLPERLLWPVTLVVTDPTDIREITSCSVLAVSCFPQIL